MHNNIHTHQVPEQQEDVPNEPCWYLLHVPSAWVPKLYCQDNIGKTDDIHLRQTHFFSIFSDNLTKPKLEIILQFLVTKEPVK